MVVLGDTINIYFKQSSSYGYQFNFNTLQNSLLMEVHFLLKSFYYDCHPNYVFIIYKPINMSLLLYSSILSLIGEENNYKQKYFSVVYYIDLHSFYFWCPLFLCVDSSFCLMSISSQELFK